MTVDERMAGGNNGGQQRYTKKSAATVSNRSVGTMARSRRNALASPSPTEAETAQRNDGEETDQQQQQQQNGAGKKGRPLSWTPLGAYEMQSSLSSK